MTLDALLKKHNIGVDYNWELHNTRWICRFRYNNNTFYMYQDVSPKTMVSSLITGFKLPQAKYRITKLEIAR